jgi:hypothetical protein
MTPKDIRSAGARCAPGRNAMPCGSLPPGGRPPTTTRKSLERLSWIGFRSGKRSGRKLVAECSCFQKPVVAPRVCLACFLAGAAALLPPWKGVAAPRGAGKSLPWECVVYPRLPRGGRRVRPGRNPHKHLATRVFHSSGAKHSSAILAPHVRKIPRPDLLVWPSTLESTLPTASPWLAPLTP